MDLVKGYLQKIDCSILKGEETFNPIFNNIWNIVSTFIKPNK